MNIRTQHSTKVAKFLDELAVLPNVSRACRISGLDRVHAYRTRAKNAKFTKDWDDAFEIGLHALEDEIARRAAEGIEEPVFYKGQVCGTINRKSDALLMFAAKAAYPKKYRDQQSVEHTGPDGGPLQLEVSSSLDAKLAEILCARKT